MDPLAHVLIGIAVPLGLLVCVALARRARPFVDPTTQAVVLRYGWLVQGIAIVSLGLPIPGVILLLLGAQNNGEFMICVGYIAIFSLLSIYSLLEAFWTRVVLIPEGVLHYTLWRGITSLSWAGVREVKYSNAAKWFVIVGRDGQKIRVNTWLAGIQEFEKAVRRHLAPTQYQRAEKGFDFVNSGAWA